MAGLAELVWPSAGVCELCGSAPPSPAFAPARVCLACGAQVFAFRGHACRVCGRPVPSARPGPVCDECTSARRAVREGDRAVTGFQRSVSLGLYGGQLAEWIKQLKYGGRSDLAGPLGQLLAFPVASLLGPGRLERELPPGPRGRPGPWEPVVVPVPLHPARLHQRGYNQAGLLAQSLAETMRFAFRAGALVRAGSSAPQATLGRRDRLHNLRGIIAAGPRGGAGAVGGRDVLLVDDVLTTGATLQACSEALLAAGARRVFGCVVAAGVPKRLWEDHERGLPVSAQSTSPSTARSAWTSASTHLSTGFTGNSTQPLVPPALRGPTACGPRRPA